MSQPSPRGYSSRAKVGAVWKIQSDRFIPTNTFHLFCVIGDSTHRTALHWNRFDESHLRIWGSLLRCTVEIRAKYQTPPRAPVLTSADCFGEGWKRRSAGQSMLPWIRAFIRSLLKPLCQLNKKRWTHCRLLFVVAVLQLYIRLTPSLLWPVRLIGFDILAFEICQVCNPKQY